MSTEKNDKKLKKLQRRKKKKNALIMCHDGKEYWTTQTEFWQWVRGCVVRKISDAPLRGKFIRRNEEYSVVISNTVLNLKCPNHLSEALYASKSILSLRSVRGVWLPYNDRAVQLMDLYNFSLNGATKCALAVILTCASAPLFVSAQTGAASAAKTAVVASQNYRIGPGDVIDVLVTKNESLSRTGVRVNAQGTIQLPMLDNDIPAACLTESQLAERVEEEYKKYLVSPSVNVSVREFNSNPVAVIGSVNSPGRFQMQRPIRLAELLTFVNGPSANAGHSIDIIRDPSHPFCDGPTLVVPNAAGEELLSFDLNSVFKGGEQANPLIKAGDVVRVPEADKVNAYIQGNIRSALAISLSEPVTLTQAIAMAGGTTSGAQLDKVSIRRQIAGSINRSEIVVNLKEINQGRRDDLLLQPNDIITVPGPSGGKKILGDIFRSIIPTITRFPVSVIP